MTYLVRRALALGAAVLLLAPAGIQAQVGSADARPRNFVFFGRDRDRIREASFLDTPAIDGAQLKYTWRELEPYRDHYDIELVRHDLAFLRAHGKSLALQLQDVSFGEMTSVPDYLRSDPAFGGGDARKYEVAAGLRPHLVFDGWVARRWDPAVRARFALLLDALGRALDGKIAAIVLPETSIAFGTGDSLVPSGFTPASYAAGIEANMAAARMAFPTTDVIQYANFMPGEFIPTDDHGYLRGVYARASELGVGVGGPDLLPHRRGQMLHSYPLIAARRPGLVAGVAVQDGNLADRDPATGKRVTVAELYRFGKERLRLDYIFWGTEEPYYSRDVIPFLRRLSHADPGPRPAQ